MNYIFCDIDGVVNYQEYLIKHRDDFDEIDPQKVKLLSKLAKQYNCRVVLSSSWRHHFDKDMKPKSETFTHFDGTTTDSPGMALQKAFNAEGIVFFGKTPTAERSTVYNWMWERPDEIEKYIKEHLTSEDKYVIFDDEDSGLSDRFGKNFIKTNFYKEGLTEDHILIAEKIFSQVL